MSAATEASGDRIAVLLFTDIVDSVDMQQRIGTREYSKLLELHDRLYREALVCWALNRYT